MMNLAFPYHFDERGRTAQTEDDRHIRDLIEQLLFTAPGERVNRPELGSGVLSLVFAPGSDELSTATQFMLQGALQQWLGDLIELQAVQVTHEDAALKITIQYIVRRTRQMRVETFSRPGLA